MSVRVKMMVTGAVDDDHFALKLVWQQFLREPEKAFLLLSQSHRAAMQLCEVLVSQSWLGGEK